MIEKIKEFEDLLLSVNRDGMDKLIEFIRKSDFYTAPASTRFHGSYEGGLLEHSLNVYRCLLNKWETKDGLWHDTLSGVSKDTIILVSLLHDLCKVYYYTTEMRNAKNDEGKWVKVPYYTVDDKYPLGHGNKSCFFIEQFIRLTMEERMAINWHMGAYVGQQDWITLGNAMDKCPLVLALHGADMEATHIIESKKDV